MKLAEVLSGPETWVQRDWSNGVGYCLLGALEAVLGQERGSHALIGVAWLTEKVRLAKVASVAPVDLIEWNNAPGRTWDEVAAVVDAYDRDRMLNP